MAWPWLRGSTCAPRATSISWWKCLLTTSTVCWQFCAADIEPRRRPAVSHLGKLRIIQSMYEPPGALMDLNVDLLLADCIYQRQALDRRVPEELAGLNLFILACEDLILHKLLAGRMIDRADCVALLRLQRAELDWAYLKNWAARLAVSDGLAEAWAEAFPGEQAP
ncbi:MAG TPA: hypothetical protein VJ783_16735 [Pirellulales bacterium]|nr:hypothetical protein [Pirellulales bacterium]